MPDQPEDIVLAEISNREMAALRAYWTVFDMDRGPSKTHFWDLRYGMVNRWPSENLKHPHIRYSISFQRSDDVDDLSYAAEHGVFPGAPETWKLLFRPGTFELPYNPKHDKWMTAHMDELWAIEERDGKDAAWAYVRQHAPPEYLPNRENWSPERAMRELEGIRQAAMDLYQSERSPIDWRPKGFIVNLPEEG